MNETANTQISREYIVLKHLTTSGFTYWRTFDPYDPDSGISGAGFESTEEALADAVYPGDDPNLYVVDMSPLGDEALKMSDKDFGDYVIQYATVELPSLQKRPRSPR